MTTVTSKAHQTIQVTSSSASMVHKRHEQGPINHGTDMAAAPNPQLREAHQDK